MRGTGQQFVLRNQFGTGIGGFVAGSVLGPTPWSTKLSDLALYRHPLTGAAVTNHFLLGNVAPPGPLPFVAITPSLQGEPKGVTTVADPVNTATGAFTHEELDLQAPSGVAGLDVSRWYNSSDPRTSVHGVGWAAGWSDTLATNGVGGYVYSESSGRVTTFAPAAVAGSWTHPVGVDANLVVRADSSPALLFANGEIAEFDLSGRLEQRVFPDGQTVTAARDATGLVTSVASSAGPSLTFTYASPVTGTRLMSVAGSWGEAVAYGYDTAGRLTSVTRPGGVVSTYTNDPASGLLTAITDASGVRQVFNVYNSDRQVVSQTAASGAVTSFTYDRVARSTRPFQSRLVLVVELVFCVRTGVTSACRGSGWGCVIAGFRG